ncbi:MAG: hypothetical protein ICV72_06870, partial [Aldersonia sp.]|nr:hypothetical protein [Aldersonia sp.]
MALIDDYSTGIGISPQWFSPPALAWPEGDESGLLAATLPVRWLALGAVMAFVVSGNRYRDAKSLPRQPNRLRLDRIAAAFSSDRLMR